MDVGGVRERWERENIIEMHCLYLCTKFSKKL